MSNDVCWAREILADLMNYVLVAVGGGLGAVGRYAAGEAAVRLFGFGFPYGTLFVNVAGSLLMGILIGVLAFRAQGDQELRLFLAIGFLGGFTTFSSFSLDTVSLVERGAVGLAMLYVGASVVLSIAGLMAGMRATRAILG